MEGKYKVKKGDTVMVFMHGLHTHPDYWIEPEKFIPDRFDPSSKYYLMPNGKKRSSLAFSPFLGGKRVCVGKTFAEVISKLVVPGIMGKYIFEF